MSTNTDPQSSENNPATYQETGLGFLKVKWRLYAFLFASITALGKFMSEGAGGEVWTQEIRKKVALAALSAFLIFAIFNVTIPYLILLLYVPFSEVLPGRFGGDIRALNLFNLLSFIVLIGWIVAGIRGKIRFFVSNSLTKLVVILCIMSVINYVFSSFHYGKAYASDVIFVLKRWLDPILLFFITSILAEKRGERKDFLVAVMLGTAMVAFLAIKDVSEVSHYSEDKRIGGVADQPNILGAFCVDYMFLFIGILLCNVKKIVYWLAIVPFWFGIRTILFTFSRGAYIAFIVASLVISFIKDKRLFIAVVILFLLISANKERVLPVAVVERLQMTRTQEDVFSYNKGVEPSIEGRLRAWKFTLDLVMKKPLFGYGFGMVYQFLVYYSNITMKDVHNTYLLLAMEHGLIWVFIFLTVVFIGIKDSFYIYTNSKDEIIKGSALGFMAGVAGFLTANFFGSHLTTLNEVAYFWVLLAIMANEAKELRSGMVAQPNAAENLHTA